jgi:hypothetical protein
MATTSVLIQSVCDAVEADPFWFSYLTEAAIWPPSIAVHLGVFVEPYLQFILDGKKSLESRFSVRRTPPFRTVREGDVLLLKEAGGPILGICQLGTVWSYELDPESFSELRLEFSAALCAQDPAFWEDRTSACFATIMRLKNVRQIAPITVAKRDRRGWVVVRARSRQLSLWEI